MKIIGVGVNWHDGYANNPSIKIAVDSKTPSREDLKFRSVMLDNHGQTLSKEQMAAVTAGMGNPAKRTGTLTEYLVAEDEESGYITFVAVGKDSDYPKGAGGGEYSMEDGTTRKISSGWYTSEAVLNRSDEFPEITDVTYLTPEYRNVGLAGYIRMDVLRPAFEHYFPWAEIVPLPDATYTVRIKEQPLKKTWMEIKQVDLDVVKTTIGAELGVDLNSQRVWFDHYQKVVDDPRWIEIEKKQYSDLLGQKFKKEVRGLRCSLCGFLEEPDQGQAKVMAMSSTHPDYFLNYVKHYHCCRERA